MTRLVWACGLTQGLDAEFDTVLERCRAELGEAAFAETAQRMDNFVRAVRLYEAARSILENIGTWWHEDKIELEKSLTACRVKLDEAEIVTAIEQGRTMTMEQAIAYALEDQG